jgi:hypothetical protein
LQGRMVIHHGADECVHVLAVVANRAGPKAWW